jgi:hypothetical protein
MQLWSDQMHAGCLHFILQRALENLSIACKWFMPLETKIQPLEIAPLLFLRIGFDFVNVNICFSLDIMAWKAVCSHRGLCAAVCTTSRATINHSRSPVVSGA